ncbi:arabinan endo-1,5-alpha-L-arabinosidase [Bacillales bacterium AN1005]|uniref:arabinan endo-1,5-alpha-L-arabinosidase n=1 Tax=Niallia taxi TaxID=2499688 RepID=UPI0021A7BAEB|nr:arabinan endo-1,5-alpha-L-arabinosidase [Niallia taxi]MCT2342908.1 arabinan endo-1,5-alpha-L-arabinosidase [Niallia taxi]
MKENTKRWFDKLQAYQWGTLGAHDPTIVKENGVYYMFATDTFFEGKPTQGVPIRKSTDLVHWEFVGTALAGIPTEAGTWANAGGLWAPEVIRYNNKYYMYYSASTFGSTVSCIGLATAEHLKGPWSDQGIVIKTNPNIAKHNAIDANIITDKNGRYWMCYGSFFGGIYIAELNMETGRLKNEQDYGTLLAKRPKSVDTAIEGAFIYYHEELDYYYLFTSYDSLNDSYNVRVARSKEITGPYVDINGNSMLETNIQPDSIGVKLVGSYQFNEDISWIGPGHNSIFTEGKKNYMVHHVRIEERSPYHFAFIREMFWLNNGWPVVSPEHYEKLDAYSLSDRDLLGKWEIIAFDDTTSIKESEFFTINDSNLAEFEPLGEHQYLHKKSGTIFIIFACKNWKEDKEGIAFSGLTPNGNTIFGKRV